VTRLQPDWKAIDVEMKLRFWNSNYVRSHFGGSLYAMTDPFYMLMLIENLGQDYIVWDKSASVRFRQSGKGKVFAAFRLSDQQIEELRRELKTQEKIEPIFAVDVKDETGAVVAEEQKFLHPKKGPRGSKPARDRRVTGPHEHLSKAYQSTQTRSRSEPRTALPPTNAAQL
jgi:hypothetical protein